MGRLILTGLTKAKGHEFKLRYNEFENEEKCWVDCTCGYVQELFHFRNYGGIKELEKVWATHTSSRRKL